MITALCFPAMSIIYTETFTTIRNLSLLPDNDDYCSFVGLSASGAFISAFIHALWLIQAKPWQFPPYKRTKQVIIVLCISENVC